MRLAILLFVVVSVSASAQDPVPDTTDWHSYFPLEVGNEWQYRVRAFPADPGFAYSNKVVRDTLISDTTFYAIRCVEEDGKGCSESETVVRYEENLSTLLIRYERSDGTIGYTQWFDILCRLDSPFGELGEEWCFWDLGGALSYGGYDSEVEIGGSPATGTFKAFDTLFGGRTFLSRVGMLGIFPDGGSGSTTLEYARISGIEYGTPVVSNEVYVPPHQSDVRTYPNPARHEATFLFTLPVAQQVEAGVYDLRGVLLESRSLGVIAGGVEVRRTMDVSKWPSGLYQIQLTGDRGFSATKGIIVIH